MIVEIECKNCYAKDVAVLNDDGSIFYNNEFYNISCNHCDWHRLH